MDQRQENDDGVKPNCRSRQAALIMPNIAFEQLASLVQKLYGFEDVVSHKEFACYDNQTILVEVTPPGNADRVKVIFKLVNSIDSEAFDSYRQQNELLLMLKGKGIKCTWPLHNLEGKTCSLEELSFKDRETGEPVTGKFVTRVMCFIPGQCIRDVPLLTPKMCYEVGQLLGQVSQALQCFEGERTEFIERGEQYIWSLNCVPRLREHCHVVKDSAKRKLVEEIVDAFEENVLKNRDNLKQGLVHGDFNDYNILVRQQSCGKQNSTDSSEKDVVGILDFDDMTHGCLVYDVAIAIMYVMQCTNLERPPVESGGIVLAGYLSKNSLTDDEWRALYYSVAARLAQSLVMGLYSFSLNPTNKYLLSSQPGWPVAFDFWQRDVSDVLDQWKKLIKEYS